MMDESKHLLDRYLSERSEEAFRGLVRRHSPLVHGTALRLLGGDRAAAQDVAQEVFALLVRKAPQLKGVVLSAWLHRQTCRRAANHVRSEIRRRQREKTAADMTLPSTSSHDPLLAAELDTALLALPSSDREALLLRFFEGLDYRAIGAATGSTEEAARKRVKRALDRLEMSLRRQGAFTGSGSLAVALPELLPVPPENSALLASKALAATPSSIVLLHWLQPAAIGAVAVSLIAGTLLAVEKSSPENRHSALAAPPARPSPVATGSSLEALVFEVKQSASGPQNAFATLRLQASLEKIPNSLIPSFIAIANDLLTDEEKKTAYLSLLRRWAGDDPASALDFSLGGNFSLSALDVPYTLFHNWSWDDPASARDWLLSRWNHEHLTAVRDRFAGLCANLQFSKEGPDAVFSFARLLPVESQRTALKAIFGPTSVWHDGREEKYLDLYNRLKTSSHHDLALDLLKFWAKHNPGQLVEIAGSSNPRLRFDISLASLSVRSESSHQTIPLLSGGILIRFSSVGNISEREQAAIQAGIDADIPRFEVMSAIGTVLLDRLPREEALAWIDLHQDEIGIDSALAGKSRAAASLDGRIGDSYLEVISIEWASRINDEALRLRLARGAFRKFISNHPAQALTYLEDNNLSPDLSAEFQAILSETE